MFRVIILVFSVMSAFVSLGAMTAQAGLRFDLKQVPNGTRYILVSGDFAYSDDLTAFEQMVRANGAVAVTFYSPGGNIPKALELGRLIRSLKLVTLQPKASECASACSLAFLGGVARYAEPGAIGVHRSSFSGDAAITTRDAVAGIQQATAEIITYMTEMGVDPALLQLALQYDSDDMRYLSMSEMEKYKVVTVAPQQLAGQAFPATPSPPAQNAPVASPQPSFPPPPASPNVTANLSIPQAHSGRIRRPKGVAPLKTLPDNKSPTLVNLSNGSPVSILGVSGRWYRAESGGRTGYLHDNWVEVDQFENGPFGLRRIQVKSFSSYAEAQAYVRASPIPLSAYLSTNGWFAIALLDTYPEQAAKSLVRAMKGNGSIPDDAYVTYGNTYVRKVCCH